MLINISNHPSEKWSVLQQCAANEQFGKVMDIPFPAISPLWNPQQVNQAVEEMFEFVLQKCEELKIDLHKLTIHLMGEMTFCFALVQQFRNKNIPCVASTTERKVLEEADGKKTVQFNFVRFRNYF